MAKRVVIPVGKGKGVHHGATNDNNNTAPTDGKYPEICVGDELVFQNRKGGLPVQLCVFSSVREREDTTQSVAVVSPLLWPGTEFCVLVGPQAVGELSWFCCAHQYVRGRVLVTAPPPVDPEDEERTRQRQQRLVDAFVHAAALNQFSVVTRRLQRREVDVDAVDVDGDNALRAAAKAGHARMVFLLLDAGANINLKHRQFKTTALSVAAEWGHRATVRALLHRGANPNSQDDDGATALHKAVYNGHLGCVEELLQVHADPTVADVWQKDPYTIAKEFGHTRKTICESLDVYRRQIYPKRVERSVLALLTHVKGAHKEMLRELDVHSVAASVTEFLTGWLPSAPS